jgi:hypothetical protein
MINFSFSLYNPFRYRFDNRFSKSWKLTENKAIEVEYIRTNILLMIDFRLSFRQDHAGLAVGLGLFGYEGCVELYDVRHWDYENNRWYVYNSKGERK